MQRLKPLLGLVNETSARNITALPREVQPRAQRTQAAKLWLPLLDYVFGSLENFLHAFWQTPAGHKALGQLLASKKVDDLVILNVERFVEKYVQQYRKDCEHALALNSTKVAKGLPHSDATLHTEKMVLYYESRDAAEQSMKNRKEKCRTSLSKDEEETLFKKLIPKSLRTKEAKIISKLQSYIVEHVNSSGGGWNVTWNKMSWIQEILNTKS